MAQDESTAGHGSTTPSRYGRGRLFRDATSLASSSLLNAAFGLVSWVITARLIDPSSLGVMTAILALMTMPALATAIPVGDAFSALLPSAGGSDRLAIVRHGEFMYLTAALVAGMLAAATALSTIESARGSWAIFLLVAFGTVAYGAYFVQSSLLAALGRVNLIIFTTLAMNICRLGILYLIATTVGWHSLEVSTVLSVVAVTSVTLPLTKRMLRIDTTEPGIAHSRDAVRGFNSYVARAFFVILLGSAVYSLTPFLVTNFGNASQGALFALSLPAVQTLDLIGAAMCTSLVVHASTTSRAEGASMARSVLIRALVAVGAGAVVIGVAGPVILQFLNPTYGQLGAASVIGVLSAASVIRVPFSAWAGLQRSRRNLKPLLIVTACAAIIALASICLLSPHFGALGGAMGVALACFTLTFGAAVHSLMARTRSASADSQLRRNA